MFDTIFKVCEIFNISLTDFFSNGANKWIPTHFKEFIAKNKVLTPGQLELLSKFINSIK